MDNLEGFVGIILGNFTVSKIIQRSNRTYRYLEQNAEITDFSFILHTKWRRLIDLFQDIQCYQNWKFFPCNVWKFQKEYLFHKGFTMLCSAVIPSIAVASSHGFYFSLFPLPVGINPQVLIFKKQGSEQDCLIHSSSWINYLSLGEAINLNAVVQLLQDAPQYSPPVHHCSRGLFRPDSCLFFTTYLTWVLFKLWNDT